MTSIVNRGSEINSIQILQTQRGMDVAKRISAAGYVRCTTLLMYTKGRGTSDYSHFQTECSAKEQDGVKEVFDEAIRAILNPKREDVDPEPCCTLL